MSDTMSDRRNGVPPRLPELLLMLPVLAATLLLACGGGGGMDSPTAATGQAATFVYRASTTLDPEVDFSTCTPTQVRFRVHLHFTWNDWEDRRNMHVAGPDEWTYSDVVPTGRDLRVALHDPNNCPNGDVYVAPAELYLNGVLLERSVTVTQGTVLEFRLGADGSVLQ